MLVGQEHHLPGNTQDKVSPWADLTKFVTEKCIRVRRVFCSNASSLCFIEVPPIILHFLGHANYFFVSTP